jgi:UDP-N-acetylglucosamine:LPS N-acetylglucosamine transferase
LKPALLVDRVKTNISDYVKLKAMGEAARNLARPDATQEIVEFIVKMVPKKSIKAFEVRSI